MADRALRGMQISVKSMESEDGVVFAERYTVRYECPNGHEFEAPLSTEAALPVNWERCCDVKRELIGEASEDGEVKPAKSARTYWDMLCERCSLEELEVVLNEQLTFPRGGRLHPEGHCRKD